MPDFINTDPSSLNFPSLDYWMSKFENTNPNYNNPGGIMFGDFAAGYGATGAAGNGLAIFPDNASGFQAMDALITQKVNQKGYDLQHLIYEWSPPNASGNSAESTSNYVKYVSEHSGIAPNEVPQSGGGTSTAGGIIGKILGGIFNSLPSTAQKGVANVTSNYAGALDISRYVAIILGLICFAGGLFLFKPVRETVISTTKEAVKTAAIAA